MPNDSSALSGRPSRSESIPPSPAPEVLLELFPVSPISLNSPDPDIRELEEDEELRKLEDELELEMNELEDEELENELELEEELDELDEDDDDEDEVLELLESLEDEELRSLGSRIICSSQPLIPVRAQNASARERTVTTLTGERV